MVAFWQQAQRNYCPISRLFHIAGSTGESREGSGARSIAPTAGLRIAVRFPERSLFPENKLSRNRPRAVAPVIALCHMIFLNHENVIFRLIECGPVGNFSALGSNKNKRRTCNRRSDIEWQVPKRPVVPLKDHPELSGARMRRAVSMRGWEVWRQLA